MMMAERVANACPPTGSKFVFKASYDKANCSSIKSARGIGMDEGKRTLGEVRDTFGCPVIMDVHEISHCAPATEVVDIIQISAFLSRQTDLLLAAGNTCKPINVKKGQFLAPWEMANVGEKIASTGHTQIMLCERGTSFSYNTLVNDFCGLETMGETEYPVFFTQRIRCNNRPGGVIHQGVNVDSWQAWLAQRALWALQVCLLRRVETLTMHLVMDQTWFKSITCQI